LKENEYSDEQISHFGATNLDRLRSTLVTKYMDSKVKFDTNLYNQVSEILPVRLIEKIVFMHYLNVDNCFLFLHRISVPKMAHGKQKRNSTSC